MASAAIKKKITPKDFGPKALLALDASVRSLTLGTLIGIASSTVNVTSPTGDKLEGLSGRFKFVPAKEGSQPLASYVLWLPSGMGADLFELPRQNTPVEFGFVVGIVRAENPVGYEWTLTPLIETAENDPLAAVLAKVNPVAALPAPEPEAAPVATEAPKVKAPKAG